jgi:putative (di)nucleoside polyphosphate hydrolase
VDNNEDYLTAALRELEEETSIKSVELVKEIDEFTTYELPKNLLGIIWKGKYKGQKQKWFIMKFTGKDEEINLKTKNPEFLEWKWVNPEIITDIVVDFKLSVYKKIKEKLREVIN